MATTSSGARTTDARTNQQDHNPKHGRRVRVKMCVSAATAVDVVLSIACISPSSLRGLWLFLGGSSWLGVGTLCTCNLPNMICADAPGAAPRRLSRTCGPDGAPGCPLGTYPRWRARALLPASGRYPSSASARIARRAVASPGEGLIRGSRASSGSRQSFG